MPQVVFDDRSFAVDSGQTVLDALLREGVDAPFSCKSGACQSCLMRVVEGAPPAKSQVEVIAQGAGLLSALHLQAHG